MGVLPAIASGFDARWLFLISRADDNKATGDLRTSELEIDYFDFVADSRQKQRQSVSQFFQDGK